jgi:hypothetical protein
MPRALQDATCHQAAGDVMVLGPFGAGLPAAQRELIFAHPDDFRALGPQTIHPAHLSGRHGQALGRLGPWRRP